MGLFDDMKRLLETQLDDFMSKNPHLQVQVLEEQLQQQEVDSNKLLVDLRLQEKQLQQEILNTGQEIKGWHERVAKAQSAGRTDLAGAAQERVDGLLRQGNQLWGKMQGLKDRQAQTAQLLDTIKVRQVELQKKAAEIKATAATNKVWEKPSMPWSSETSKPDRSDPLEAEFLKWETEEELARLKKNLGN
jgi:uncharacterized protein (TIGR04376 family)